MLLLLLLRLLLLLLLLLLLVAVDAVVAAAEAVDGCCIECEAGHGRRRRSGIAAVSCAVLWLLLLLTGSP